MSILLGELFKLPNNFNPKTTEGLKTLNEYQFLLQQTAQAAFAFLGRDFSRFDPNIGDCACQIRTVKTILLARDSKLFSEMQTLASRCMQLQEACAGQIAIKDMKKSDILNKQLDVKPDLSLSLSQDVAYLVQAYLFTLTQEKTSVQEDPLCAHGKINSSRLYNLSGNRVTKKKAEKIAYLIRQNLSLASLEFIREQAQISNNVVWINACSQTYTQQFNNDFYSVPMFYSYQILLHTYSREAVPILFKVKLSAKDGLTNEKPLSTEYIYLNGQDNNQETALCVFEGVRQDSAEKLQTFSRLCNNTLKISGERVILAGAADHPQYAKATILNNTVGSIEDLEESIAETDRLAQYAARAQAVGCSLINPSLFFIQHVYPQSRELLLKEMCSANPQIEGVVDV